MSRKLQLDSAIAADIQTVNADSYIDSLKMIDIDSIEPNRNNFYEISEIESLADDIERQGLMNALVVSEDDGRYELISGHRRLAALKSLIADGRRRSGKVPCFIKGAKPNNETELDLIMLNATQRKYSDADTMREYEELTRIFKELEAAGKPVKGRIRDRIADALNASPAQVGKLDNIKHNAIPDVEQAVKSGDMSISTVNEVAKLAPEKQQKIISEKPQITHKEVKDIQRQEKVSDHHAIIPTENIGNAVNMELTSDEKQILHLVIRRLLEALSAQYEYMDIEYVFDICGETFKLKQKKPVNLGWKALCPDDVEIPPEINYSENDTFYVDDIFITEGETKPPKCYTESSLLKAMENIDRRIEDKELSGYVSERGLGTPATRAAIIEKILADGYAERKNKVISATEMGIKMINFVPPEIKSVEMTAAMKLQLAAIENGTASADEVISSITEKIKAIIEAEKHRAHTPVAEPRTAQKNPVGKCPKCGGNVYKFARDNTGIFYCEKAPKDCIFRVYEDDYFFTSKGKKLTEPMMKNLLLHGEVKVGGFKSEKTGNTYTAVVSFADRTDKNGNAKIGFTMRFEDKKKR